jgi:hypothetical protein
VSENLDELVTFRVCSTASSVKIPENSFLHEANDIVSIETLGKIDDNDIRNSEIVYNLPLLYNVLSVESSSNLYKIKTIVENNLKIGEDIELIFKNNLERQFKVIDIEDKKTFFIELDISLSSFISEDLLYVRRKLQKLDAQNYLESNYELTNVQNTYYDDENNLYIMSSSLPNYKVLSKNVNKKISGSFIDTEDLYLPNHGFISGDFINIF